MAFGSPTRRKCDKYCSGMWVREWAQVGGNKTEEVTRKERQACQWLSGKSGR